jgi:hypothetical protein
MRGAILAILSAIAAAGCESVPDIDFARPDGGPAEGGGDGAALPWDSGIPDGGLFCGDSAVSSCGQCPGAPLECRSGGRCTASCKNDCGGSSGEPIECIGCSGSRNAVVFRCAAATDPASCLSGAVTRCQAPDDVTNCPGARQVRLNDECYACGEPGTGGQDCRSGATCSTNGANAFECP